MDEQRIVVPKAEQLAAIFGKRPAFEALSQRYYSGDYRRMMHSFTVTKAEVVARLREVGLQAVWLHLDDSQADGPHLFRKDGFWVSYEMERGNIFEDTIMWLPSDEMMWQYVVEKHLPYQGKYENRDKMKHPEWGRLQASFASVDPLRPHYQARLYDGLNKYHPGMVRLINKGAENGFGIGDVVEFHTDMHQVRIGDGVTITVETYIVATLAGHLFELNHTLHHVAQLGRTVAHRCRANYGNRCQITTDVHDDVSFGAIVLSEAGVSCEGDVVLWDDIAGVVIGEQVVQMVAEDGSVVLTAVADEVINRFFLPTIVAKYHCLRQPTPFYFDPSSKPVAKPKPKRRRVAKPKPVVRVAKRPLVPELEINVKYYQLGVEQAIFDILKQFIEDETPREAHAKSYRRDVTVMVISATNSFTHMIASGPIPPLRNKEWVMRQAEVLRQKVVAANGGDCTFQVSIEGELA